MNFLHYFRCKRQTETPPLVRGDTGGSDLFRISPNDCSSPGTKSGCDRSKVVSENSSAIARPDRSPGDRKQHRGWVCKILDRLAIAFVAAVAFVSLLGCLHFPDRFVAANFICDTLSHFRVQYLALSLAGLLFVGRRDRRPWQFLALACVALHAVAILPYYLPPAHRGAAVGEPTRLLFLNVLWQSEAYDRVLALVERERPDIAAFAEVSDAWAEALSALEGTYPYTARNGEVMLFSRYPLEDKRDNVFLQHRANRNVAAIARIGDRSLNLVLGHLTVPLTRDRFQERNQQLLSLGAYLTELEAPAIAIGDFNVTSWSHFYRRAIPPSGFYDARAGFGVLPSWPNKPPLVAWPLALPIDRFLLSPKGLRAVSLRVGDPAGSDHYSLILDATFVINAK